MTYRVWRQWVQSLPWSLKWFVLLVLFRPVLDALYFLKDISPFLSPLYLMGVLTPVLVVVSYLSDSFPKKAPSALDFSIGLWAWLLLFNALAVLIKEGVSVEGLEMVFHIVTPAFIYFYLRHFMQSRRELLGLITTTLYSIVLPSVLVMYENIFTPFSAQASRGLTRFQGVWADVASYGIFFSVGLLAACYFFLERNTGVSDRRRTQILVLVVAVCMIGLLSIHHATSWAVFAALFALFIGHGVGSRGFSVMLVGLTLIGAGFLLFDEAIDESVGAVVEREMSVVERQDKGFESAFHGRGLRWMGFLSEWESMPIFSKLFGVASGALYAQWEAVPIRLMLMKGTHNDYLRILFATGLVGLLSYILFGLSVFWRSWKFASGERLLIQGALAIMALFAVSLTPTLYPMLQYVCFGVFAYAALPSPSERMKRARVVSERKAMHLPSSIRSSPGLRSAGMKRHE